VKASQNSQVTNLGVTHKIDGHVIDITDTAMQRQVRRQVERKIEDKRIVGELKAMLRGGYSPEAILEYAGARVAASTLT
jgi:hypothetical protein